MSRLTLKTLGTPEVRHAGEVLQFRTRKSLALLIYLALSPNRTRARTHLYSLLWPDKPEDQARQFLAYTKSIGGSSPVAVQGGMGTGGIT